MALLSFFPFFHFPLIHFSFLFCFSSSCQRVVLLNFLDIKANPNSLLFSQRERESSKSSREGWSGDAMVLGRPTYLDNRRTRAYCARSRCGWGCLDIFSLIYLFSFLSSSLRDGPIETEILSQRTVKSKITNQASREWFGNTSL